MSVVERALDKLRRGSSDRTTADIHSIAAAKIEVIGTLVPAPAHVVAAPHIVIDFAALRAAGYLPEEKEGRRFADEYRQIKRPLLANAFGPEAAGRQPTPRLVMMSSALPGDGKTFTSINLALSIARERDTSVVLVDGDVAKPHISRIFGVGAERGLLDALADPSIEVESLILPTDVKGLFVLPAGAVREGATELLSSARMTQVAARILSQHPRSIALFDSSPLAISSESPALSVAMGQIIVVVRAGHTPRRVLLDALEGLGPDRLTSLVLNQGRRGVLSGYYGYRYGAYGEKADG